MREIKFRAWDGENMHYESDARITTAYRNEQLAQFLNERYACDLMQYTGLKDRDGAEIYEGDVVEFHAHYFNGGSFDNDYIAIGAVEITEHCELCIKVLKRKQGSLNNKYFHVADTTHFEEPCIKVHGNIHQHPELLEAE